MPSSDRAAQTLAELSLAYESNPSDRVPTKPAKRPQVGAPGAHIGEQLYSILASLRSEVEQLNAGQANLLLYMQELLSRAVVREDGRSAYSTAEFATMVKRKPVTVRRWCREHRISATQAGGRGPSGEYRISHEELVRYRNQGLLRPKD